MSAIATGMRLNFGCGETRLPGYLGVDIRPGQAVDYVLPAWETSLWPAESVDAIYSRHMLEHLDPPDARQALRAWFDLLAPGGLLQLIVPDLEFHARQLIGLATSWSEEPAQNLNHAMASFYGWRDPARGGHAADVHRWGYTWASLKALLDETGFVKTTRVTSGPDSEPWHLHVTARKPGEEIPLAPAEPPVDESVSPRDAVERARSVLNDWHGPGRVAVFGAGAHTRKILPALHAHASVIAGIADDDPASWGRQIGPWTVESPETCIQTTVTGILVSSDVHQESLAARLRPEYGTRCAILTLYTPSGCEG